MANSLADRFGSKVDKSGGPDACWLWTGHRIPTGYGAIGVGKNTRSTHRLSWELANGPIPEGQHVLHRCDNPPCVNPNHLFLGTHADNVRDMHAKGRSNLNNLHPRMRCETHGSAKLTNAQVREIRTDCRRGQGSVMARKYGVTRNMIGKIVRREYWKDLD